MFLEFKVTEEKAKSLSARRAWIEIGWSISFECDARSLSARRAWIEILQYDIEKC